VGNKARHVGPAATPGGTNKMNWLAPLLAPEYDLRELCGQLKLNTGVSMVVCFHSKITYQQMQHAKNPA